MSSTDEYEGRSLSELQRMIKERSASLKRSQDSYEVMKKMAGADEEMITAAEKRPRIDMNNWTPAREAALRRELQKAVEYLHEHGQDTTVEELRRLWGVGNAYAEEERNMALSYEVHEIFAQILDREKRQELLFSRDDWTPRSAQLAVDAWHQLPDGNRRLMPPPAGSA